MTFAEQTAQPSPQVLLVGEKDRKRLLEVYVKRSLSLNDGTQALARQRQRQSKWVSRAPQNKRERTYSSDSSLRLSPSDFEDDSDKYVAFSECETMKKNQATREQTETKSKRWRKNSTVNTNNGSSVHCRCDSKPMKRFLHFDKDKRDGKQQSKACKIESDAGADETLPLSPLPDQLPVISVKTKKPKEGKKKKKSSVWKNFLGWFSKGNSDKHKEQVGGDDRHEEVLPTPEPSTPPLSCLPLSEVLSSGEVITWMKRRQSQRKTSLKRLSGLDNTTGRPLTLDLSAVDHKPMVKSIEEVEPTSFYYENVSEELHKIVHEVKNSPLEDDRIFCGPVQPTDLNTMPMSQEEVIERIIALIKQQGDAIDSKLKENPTVSGYFSTLSYGSFQQLADQYVQYRVPQQKSHRLMVAPELVRFAVTLDFTARVAALSCHALGHIVGLGNQYVKDRFTHMSERHPPSNDITVEKRESYESINKEDKEQLSENK